MAPRPGDIRDVRLLYAKAGLFLLCGGMASGLLLLEHPTFRVAGLLLLAIWCFSRAYYFAFYVVEHYADPGFHYAGLFDFVRYVLGRRKT